MNLEEPLDGLEYEVGAGDLEGVLPLSVLGGAGFSLPVFDPVTLEPGFIWFLYWLLLLVEELPEGAGVEGLASGLLDGLLEGLASGLLSVVFPV